MIIFDCKRGAAWTAIFNTRSPITAGLCDADADPSESARYKNGAANADALLAASITRLATGRYRVSGTAHAESVSVGDHLDYCLGVVVNGTIDETVIRVKVVGKTIDDLHDIDAGVKVDLDKILGTALTESAGGRLAAAVKKFFDIAAPTLTTESANQSADAPAAAAIAAAVLDEPKGTHSGLLAGVAREETVAAIRALAEADLTTDTSKTPWELAIKNRATGVVLLRKKLRQIAGDVLSVDHLVANQTEE